MTQTERVASLHARMAVKRGRLQRQKAGALSAAAAIITVCLILTIYAGSAARPGGTASPYSGAMMLFENAGAYVLVTLLAFMAGTLLSVLLIRRGKQADDAPADKENGENDETREQKEENR